MGKVKFQVDGIDSNKVSEFNQDVTFDGNIDSSGYLQIIQSITNGSDPLVIKSKNAHGGSGYAGIITIENTTNNATNSKKHIRLDSIGNLEIVNNAYSATIFSLTDTGLIQINGTASTDANAQPTSYGSTYNNNGSIFDDGNFHIHSKNGVIWINAGNGGSDVQINKQGAGTGGLLVGGQVTASNLSGDSGWIQVTSFTNSFTAVSGNSVYYRKLNGVVYLRGAIQSGTAGQTAFTLPTGFRPPSTVTVAVQQYGTPNITYMEIHENGNVNPTQSSAWLSSAIFAV